MYVNRPDSVIASPSLYHSPLLVIQKRLLVQPGSFLDIPIEFRPVDEEIFIGQLVIETSILTVPIELVGTGREALLTYDKNKLDFVGCMCGNTYVREFTVMNVGELNYPLTIKVVSGVSVIYSSFCDVLRILHPLLLWAIPIIHISAM